MVEAVGSYREFMDVIKTLKYKEKDKIEVIMEGDKSIADVYSKIMYKDLCKFFFVKDNETKKVLATIALDRCGFLTFFVTKDLEPSNALGFVKDIKKLARQYATLFGSILVKTANFYKEAEKLVKLVGFKPYHLLDYHTIWIIKDKDFK